MPGIPDIDEPVAGTPDLIRIPPDIWRALLNAGYTGSRYIYASDLRALANQYGINNNDDDGDDVSDAIADFLAGLGGSGGGSYSSGPSPADLRNLRASFLEVLHAWGLGLNKNLTNLVQQGVNQTWSTTNFMQHLRNTSDYRQAFAGIQKGQTEEAYIYAYDQFRDKLKDLGKNLTTQQFGQLNKKGVDYEEFSMRVAALDRVMNDRDLFDTFGEILKQRGLIKGKYTMKDAVDFVRKKGSPIFEKVWEEAAFTTGLESAGIAIQRGPEGDITRKQLVKMLGQYESRNPGAQVEDLGSEFYGQLAERVRTLIPASRMAQFNLTNTDILELQMGGPRANKIAETVNQILANVERIKTGALTKPQAQGDQGRIRVAGLEEERAQTA